jgi:hypothetical protein
MSDFPSRSIDFVSSKRSEGRKEKEKGLLLPILVTFFQNVSELHANVIRCQPLEIETLADTQRDENPFVGGPKIPCRFGKTQHKCLTRHEVKQIFVLSYLQGISTLIPKIIHA